MHPKTVWFNSDKTGKDEATNKGNHYRFTTRLPLLFCLYNYLLFGNSTCRNETFGGLVNK